MLFITNIVFPGVGTIAAGVIDDCNSEVVCVGVLQILLSPVFFIGWVWAIVWGFKLYDNAAEAEAVV